MISHKYKCIFIHIQRTAGTSIEDWIVGKDWWNIEKETKHLLASQAKNIYKDYWKDYFKFAFVRNPWDRVFSCLTFSKHFGINYKDGILNLDQYKVKYGYPLIVENDPRFYDRNKLITKRHQKNCVYLNILDEKLDFIGKYESLKKDTNYIRNKLHIERKFNIDNKIAASTSGISNIARRGLLTSDVGVLGKMLHKRREFATHDKLGISLSRKDVYGEYYNEETKNVVESIYRKDIKTFGYEF